VTVLTAKQKQAQQEMASRVLARRRLLPFAQRMNPKYLAGWVHEDICRRLERFSDEVAAGKSPRLMLLMPPRHGKSELASKMFPPWHLGRHPDHEIIACSYNISLAMGFSKKIKGIFDDPTYQTVFDARLDQENRSTEEWGIAGTGGGYVAAGVGGGITGKGAHILIIDDPIKNAEEADSLNTRESIWDWYGSTAYTRLAPGAGVLIIQTWWHDDDLAGRVQQAMAAGQGDEDVDQFEIIKYPAIAEAAEFLNTATDEIVRVDTAAATAVDALIEAAKLGLNVEELRFLRAKGDCLHEARYDNRKLRKIKATIAGRFWSALYQQNPVPDDGAFFTKDMFKRGPLPQRKDCNVQIAWDFAIGIKKHNDYTIGTVALQDSSDMLHYAEQIAMKTNDLALIVKAILDQAQRWYQPNLILGFEDGQIWKTLESTLMKECRLRKFYPRIQVLPPLTDKEARASPLKGRMQAGMVSFSDKDDWYDACRNELLRFPAGIHDDRVDSCAWVAQIALGRAAPRPAAVKPGKSWRDKLNARSGTSHMAA
jgi:predicted phage terminase large subunit-like protein